MYLSFKKVDNNCQMFRPFPLFLLSETLQHEKKLTLSLDQELNKLVNQFLHQIRTHLYVVAWHLPGVVVCRAQEAWHCAIKTKVAKMLHDGILEESTSHWFTLIMVVPKPDVSLGFCNDFCCLNQVLEFKTCPLPQVDNLNLTELSVGTHFISTIDLTKG